MKARIPANKDRKPKTDTHYRHIESLFRKADLTVTDKYVLSYMRFMPESGVPKMLFQKLTRLIDFTEIDKLIDIGFIHDNSDGTISITSIVRKLVEADYKINPEEMLAFGETLFSTDTSEAPKEVLAEIADRISPLKYLTMIESDVFVAYHLLFQFYFKIGSNFSTDMAIYINSVKCRNVKTCEPHIYYNGDLEIRLDVFELAVKLFSIVFCSEHIIQLRLIVFVSCHNELYHFDRFKLFLVFLCQLRSVRT